MSFFKRIIDKPTKPDEFARLASEAMRRCGWAEPAYDAAAFSLRVNDHEIYSLSNVFDTYTNASSAERPNLLDRWFEGLRDQRVPDTFEEARPSLMLMLRQRREPLTTSVKLNLATPARMLGRPLSDDLDIAVAYDRPSALTRLAPESLQTWAVDEDTVVAAAEANLRKKSAPSWKRDAPGVATSAWSDSFDAARLLLADVVATAPIDGEKVVMVPDRDRLYVASANDVDGLSRMATLALAAYDENRYPLSAGAFVVREGIWRSFEMPEAVRYDIQKRRVAVLQDAYGAQKTLLDRSSPDDIFVATFQAYASDQQRQIFSASTWTIGVPTLLPKTDQLMLVRAEKDVVRVHWDDAMRIAGERIQVSDGWPQRYVVRTFPSDAELSLLREAKVK